MRPTRTWLRPIGRLALAAGLIATTWAGTPPATAATALPGAFITSPNPGRDLNQLFGVEAISPTDVWAVGDYTDAGSGRGRTLALHWNGTGWSHPWTPSPYDAGLSDVSATSSTDVWAVGSFWGPHGARTLAIHWDGTRWTRFPTPNPSTSNNLVESVTAISPSDVWAVGYYANAERKNRTLALHWNGTAWRHVWSPNPSGRGSMLRSVSGVASNDVWAVGSYALEGAWGLVLHWDGTAWVKAFARRGQLNAVSAAGPDDVWAVGELGLTRGVTLHFDGTTWTDIAPPPIATSPYGVVALGPSGAWAIGSTGEDDALRTFAMRWDGSDWGVVATPNPGDVGNELYDVSATSPADVWAVGRSYRSVTDGVQRLTLVIRWSGAGWFRV